MLRSAKEIASALGGRRCGGQWSACCPAHDDQNASLSITDRGNKVLVHCFGGCSFQQVRDALASRGLWEVADKWACDAMWKRHPSKRAEPEDDQAKRYEKAFSIWNECQSATDTAVQAYLMMRGITVPPPPSIRFHPHLWHETKQYFPAMVALITRGVDKRPLGIHRTFLRQDGTGKAPVEKQKMMLGTSKQGVVRMGAIDRSLIVGEGIETCLSVFQALGGVEPVWSALSQGNMRELDLPVQIRRVTIIADADEKGLEAANVAAERWAGEGRTVSIATPPDGTDFNDVLTRDITIEREAPE